MILKGSFDEAFDRALVSAWPGQAHLAGTGPAGTTCRECALWAFDGYFPAGTLDHAAGTLKPAPCAKYRELVRRPGKHIPHSAKSCRHFVENPNPPKAAV